jgi:hypothetical protein
MSSPPELALLHLRRSLPPAMSSPPRLPCWTPAFSVCLTTAAYALLHPRRLCHVCPAPPWPGSSGTAGAGKLGAGRDQGLRGRGGAHGLGPVRRATPARRRSTPVVATERGGGRTRGHGPPPYLGAATAGVSTACPV